MRSSHITLLLAALAAFCLCGCDRPSRDPATVVNEPRSGVVTIFVVNYPLKYFAERIGGKHVRVVFPAPSGEDPAFWTPDAETIAAYQNAELILLNGATYAKWTNTVSLPASRTVDTSASLKERFIKVEDSVSHSHGTGAEHAHAGTAFTTWLDPTMAAAQAAEIQQALARARPQYAAEFQRNLAALQADLNDLDRQFSAAVEGHTEQPIFFSHPVYQYLQRRYQLNGKSVHWEPGEVPTEEARKEFQELLAQHPAKRMVWEGPPIQENVKWLAELGVQSTVIDPCGNRPEDGDYLEVMRHNVENLRRALAGDGAGSP